MASLHNEIKPVLRRLMQAPGFTLITMVTLAIGIGANTAIFSVLDGVLLKPLPYPQAEQLVGVWETAPGLGWKDADACPATYFTFREENRTLQDIGLWRHDSVSVTGSGEPEQVPALFVTDAILPLLRVPAVRGRWFSRQDDLPGSPKTMLLGYGYWQRKFGGNSSVLGRRVIVDGEAREIIGILPAKFRFMDRNTALVLPFQLDRAKTFIGNFSYRAIARLKPGVSLPQANADEARMIPLMGQKFGPPPGMSMKMIEEARLGPDIHPLKDDVVGDIGKMLWVLMATIGAVLFIACANVANLMLVRAEGRQHELAIRAALGANRWSIARELLTESVTLGLLGGAGGLVLAYGALRLLTAIGPANLPRLDEISINPTVLLFALAISLAAGIFFGLIPVFKYAGAHVVSALRQGGRTSSDGRERHRTRNVLVVVQVALALVLLISSGLMIRTIRALRQVRPGFTQPEQILTLHVSIPEAQIAKPEQVTRLYGAMAEKIAALPGVKSVGITNSITMDFNTDHDPVFARDHVYSEAQIPPLRTYKFISPGYFQAMGNHLVAGRNLTWTDIYDTRPVVLVSETLARDLWHDTNAAIGKQVRETPKAPWREIVGVAADERDDGADHKAPAIIYWPMMLKDFWKEPLQVMRDQAFAIRSSRTGSASFLSEVRQAIWSVNPNIPIAEVRTMQEVYDKSMARTSFTLVMLTLAAGMALLLGIVGIYGVISYSVSRRTREIGIRMALGAPQPTLSRLFLREGFLLAAIGLGCGLVAALGLTRLMAALLFGVGPLDPWTYACVSAVLLAAALVASYLPARRAAHIEPLDALRVE